MTPPRITPTQMALKALEAIAKHEKECSARWGSTEAQMLSIHQQLERHGTRWERLSWFIICSVMAGIVTLLFQNLI